MFLVDKTGAVADERVLLSFLEGEPLLSSEIERNNNRIQFL